MNKNLRMPHGVRSLYMAILADKIHAVAWGHIQYGIDNFTGPYYERGEINNSKGQDRLVTECGYQNE